MDIRHARDNIASSQERQDFAHSNDFGVHRSALAASNISLGFFFLSSPIVSWHMNVIVLLFPVELPKYLSKRHGARVQI